jgi:hypothetical protein
MSKLLKILAISIALLVAITVSGAFYVSSQAPKWVKTALNQYGDAIGYDITFDKFDLSIRQLRLEVDGIHIAKKKNNEHLLSIKKSIVDLDWLDLFVKRIRVSEIKIDTPIVTLKRDKKYWNWQEFLEAVQKHSGNKVDKKDSTPFEFLIDQFKLSAGKIDLSDSSIKLKTQLAPLDIELKNLTNRDTSGSIGGIESGYSIKLGSLNIPIPNSDKSIKFNHVRLFGKVDVNDKSDLKLFLNAEVDQGGIDSVTELQSASGKLTSSIKLHKVSIAPVISLLPTNKPLVTNSGDIDGDFSIQNLKDSWGITGSMVVSKLSVFEPDKKNELIGWDSSDISGIELKGGKDKTSLTINSIKVAQPKGRLIVYEDKTTNFRRLFSKEPPPVINKPSSVNGEILSDESKQTSKPVVVEQKTGDSSVNLDIKSVALDGAQFEFTDYGIKPMFQSKIHHFHGTILGLSNQPNRYASLAFNGLVDKSGEVTFRGQTSFEDPRRNNDVVLAFKKIPLRSVNPYSMTFAGYEIKGGTVSVTLAYRVKDYELKGGNRIVINRIELGPEVQDFKGKSLPLSLAIALLEDGDGVIDLNIPVSGNINNPQFNLGGLVWQAITTVFTNIVSAPFRAVGHLLGIENFEGVYFDAGDSSLHTTEKDKLERVATALAKRPKVKLLINGSYDPDTDAAQLGRSVIDRAIFAAANFKVSPSDPIPTLSLDDERIQAAIRLVYADRIGRIKLLQKQVGLVSASEKAKLMRDELIANEKVGVTQLEALAMARANIAMRSMIEIDKNLESRLAIGEIKVIKGDQEGVPLSVEFANM